jgi:small-conductance mechanosensitive channel
MMSKILVFVRSQQKLIALSLMISAMVVMTVSGASAQSFDVSGFQGAIEDGIQSFFDNIVIWLAVAFPIFAIIFALAGGFNFAQRMLDKLVGIFSRI